MRALPLVCLVALLLTGCPSQEEKAAPSELAPVTTGASYVVEFTTTKGTFELEVYRSWAPLGADRFRELVESGYFDGCAFFRVLEGFVVQFGLSPDPARTSHWLERKLSDDPVLESNRRGTITFAMAGPGTRTSQVFLNLADNPRLDKMGFSPFGRVTKGFEVVESLFGGYGEGAPRGPGPDQGRIMREGKAYLEQDFPKLDTILTAKVLPPS